MRHGIILCWILTGWLGLFAAPIDSLDAASPLELIRQADTLVPVTIEFTDQTGVTTALPGLKFDGLTYLPAFRFAALIGANFFWKEETKKLVIRVGVYQIKLTGGNRVVGINDQLYCLPRPVRYRQGTLYVPVYDFVDLVKDLIPGGFAWHEGTRKLAMQNNINNITDLEIKGNTISLYLSEKLTYEKSLSEPNWFHINFSGGRFDPKITQVKSWEAIKEIKTYQFDNSAQISFLFGTDIKKFETVWDEKRTCLTISFGQKVGAPEAISKNETIGILDCIVIDAGHGGKDPGAIGPSGLKEKEVVLDVAKRLAGLLKRQTNMKIILTREDDTFIPLRERTQIANRNGAKLFVSIHANANRSRKVSGFETYFLSQEKNDEARLVAAMENSVIKFEIGEEESKDMTNLDFIMWDMAQNEFAKESQDFAVMIQESMSRRLNISNRGVKQARFFVLNGAFMPNVLVEIAFISNHYEEKLLRKRKFRAKIAEALCASIIQFKKKYEESL